jgi:Fe-S-cluster containining protein
MSDCNRCGECCRWVAIFITGEPDPATLEWMTARGIRIEGSYMLIPSVCHHLQRHWDGNAWSWACNIEDRKPYYCRVYPGEGVWKPKGCSL